MGLPGESSSLIIFLVTAVVAVGYFMYMNGIGYFRSMSVLWFYQTQGILEDNIHASLKKISGEATKVFKVKESGFYDFNLDNELESGNVTVNLIDSLGDKVFELNKMNGFSSGYLNESERYRLVFNYNEVCGKLELSWEQIWGMRCSLTSN